MKKYLCLILLFVTMFSSPLLRRGAGGEVFGQYAHQNIDLLAHWDTSITVSEPIFNIRYNSVWGWVDPQDSTEYAILGSTDGTYFFDVSDPQNPKMKDYVKGRRDSCIWREYKDYQGYLYAVSDDQVDANNQNSLQIIDMSYLPDSVHVAYDSDTLFYRAHTAFIDGNKMYCGYVHGFNKAFSMGVYSLANPVAPSYLRNLDLDDPSFNTVHDMFVRNDTVYASCGNEGLHIYKFDAINGTFTQIGSLTNYLNYGQGYNHSSALTADGNTLIFTDEYPAHFAVKSVDVSDFGNITVLDTFRSTYPTIATPHNVYIPNGSNSRVVVAYYQDGVQIFDISNPSNVTRTGFFDTAPLDCPTCNTPDFSGCWGAYIDLPSGIILASDMQDGLFVLENTGALGVPSVDNNLSLAVYPNPFTDNFQVNLSLPSSEYIYFELSDISGKVLMKKQMNFSSGNSSFNIDVRSLSAGTYLLNMKGTNFLKTEKIIKSIK